MRKTLSLILLSLLALCYQADAQTPDLNQPVPFDPTVRTGKLPNGLTYYLKENAKPENRLLLQLAVNAGSVNENDSQQGLAHFVEHMCFNGTKTWKGNDLINMLESMGVRFGYGLNAFTSYDETVYMLEIPTDNPDNIDKGFQVMEEWAHEVSMEDAEIEKERGVILEEWRLGLGANERMRQQYQQVILKGSRYAERFVIGKEEILRTFPPDTLRSFYRSWYRPDNMALIAVGDLDVAEMEVRMIAHFGAIKKPLDPLNRIEYGIPDNKEPLVSVVTDKEAMGYNAQLFFKYPAYKILTIGDYRRKLAEQLYTSMLNKRLSEIGVKPESPFAAASVNMGPFIGRLTNASMIGVTAKENKLAESLELALTESERVRQHGFTLAELDREKKAILTNLDNAVKEADKVESDSWANRMINHFLKGGLVLNPLQNQEIIASLLPGISLADVNDLGREMDLKENIAGVVIAPEKEGAVVPAENEIVGIIRSVSGKTLEPYVETVSDNPLLPQMPVAGEIASRVENSESGYTEITFSNGARVVVKSTDFKNDEINFSAVSHGGLSLLPDEDLITGQLASTLIQQGGLGEFDIISLRKKLTGIRASISPNISEITEGLAGFSTVKDFETMLQLNYLWFTHPRKDPETFKATIDRLKTTIKSYSANPQFIFMDSINRLAYGNHPRAIMLPSEEQIDQIKIDRAYEIVRDRIRDASDFTFFLVGSVNLEEVLPLLKTYIGGLPSEHRKETFRDVDPDLVDRVVDVEMPLNSEQQSMVVMYFNGDFDWNESDRLLFTIMMQTMNIKLREQMREEQGGVYGVSFQEVLSKYPEEEFTIVANWGCSPETVDTLTQTIFGEMERIRAEGPTETDLAKIKETLVKDYEKDIMQNSFWMREIQNHYLYGNKIHTLDEYKKAVESVTIEDVRRIANKYLDSRKYIRGVLMPKG